MADKTVAWSDDVASKAGGSFTFLGSSKPRSDRSMSNPFDHRLAFAMLLLTAAAGARSAAAADQPEKPAPKKRDITFDDILLDMKKGDTFKTELLTDKVKKIEGKTVKIRGYILPGFQQSGIKQFVLVRDNMQCCFGPGAALHDCILVEMLGDATTNFTVVPVSVEGKFTVNEVLGPDGKHLAIYHLDAKTVK